MALRGRLIVMAAALLPGTSFVPVSGTIRAAGGTGAAATWRGSLGFKQVAKLG
jgi:hypothetical protein